MFVSRLGNGTTGHQALIQLSLSYLSEAGSKKQGSLKNVSADWSLFSGTVLFFCLGIRKIFNQGPPHQLSSNMVCRRRIL